MCPQPWCPALCPGCTPPGNISQGSCEGQGHLRSSELEELGLKQPQSGLPGSLEACQQPPRLLSDAVCSHLVTLQKALPRGRGVGVGRRWVGGASTEEGGQRGLDGRAHRCLQVEVRL